LPPPLRESVAQVGIYQVFFGQIKLHRPSLAGKAFVFELLGFSLGQFFQQISNDSFFSHLRNTPVSDIVAEHPLDVPI
jgi:hypothetical protein